MRTPPEYGVYSTSLFTAKIKSGVLICAALVIALTTLIAVASLFLMKTSLSDVDDLRPFECGFEEFTIPRNNFSIKFYMVAIVFLVFDVEIAVMLPLLVSG